MRIDVRWHSLVVFGLLLVAAAVTFRSISRPGEGYGPNPSGDPGCDGVESEECLPSLEESRTGTPTNELAALPASEACTDAGYLCGGMDERGTFRAWRWPSGTPGISVAVPEPTQLPSSDAKELQRAAVRGFRSWTGHPFPLSITMGPGQADVMVTWSTTLEEGRLGRAQVEWRFSNGRVLVKVLGLQLAVRAPGPYGRTLRPHEVELVAAHEMGHVLGLPHSGDPRDVMYPENTATRLTTRDFLTLEALYRLPNGAEIRR